MHNLLILQHVPYVLLIYIQTIYALGVKIANDARENTDLKPSEEQLSK